MVSVYGRDGVPAESYSRDAHRDARRHPSGDWPPADFSDEPRSSDEDGWSEEDLDLPGRLSRAFQFLTRNEMGQAVAVAALVTILGAGPLIMLWTRSALEERPTPQQETPAVSTTDGSSSELSVLHIAPQLSLDPVITAEAGRPLRLAARIANFHIGDTVQLTGLPPDFALSSGDRSDAGWRVAASDLAALQVIPPQDFVGAVDVAIDYLDAATNRAEHKTGRLEWTRQASASASEEGAPPLQMTPPDLRKGVAVKTDAPAVGQPQAPAASSQAHEAVQAHVERRAQTTAKPAASSVGVATNSCVAKIDGKMLLMGHCRVFGKGSHRVTLESGDKRFILNFERDRMWRLEYGGQSVGKVFKTDGCWGGDRAYVCESRGAAKPEKHGRPRPAAFTDATPRTDPDVPSPGRVRLPFEELFEAPAAR